MEEEENNKTNKNLFSVPAASLSPPAAHAEKQIKWQTMSSFLASTRNKGRIKIQMTFQTLNSYAWLSETWNQVG